MKNQNITLTLTVLERSAVAFCLGVATSQCRREKKLLRAVLRVVNKLNRATQDTSGIAAVPLTREERLKILYALEEFTGERLKAQHPNAPKWVALHGEIQCKFTKAGL